MDKWEDIAPAADAVARELASEHDDHRQAAQGALESPLCNPAPETQAPFGLVGASLAHSWSPRIHNTLGSSPYGLFSFSHPEDAADFFMNGDWQGLNVTIPYKRLAASCAQKRTPLVEELGAANTLVRLGDGTLLAENTDLWGFDYLLHRFCETKLVGGIGPLAGRKALVLGSGGASQAIQAALRLAGLSPAVISRSGGPQNSYEGLATYHQDACLLVNTTPVGMYPECQAAPVAKETLSRMPGLLGVLDLVYNPAKTQLMLDAEALGLPAMGGLLMLVAQAFRSSEIWQGASLDLTLIDRIAAQITAETRSVYFIGMPGCGKTGCARRLARMANRPFVDLDDAFEIDWEMTPGQCIAQEGEKAFRTKETHTLAATAKEPGLIVACGGGIVCREANLDLMRHNGIVIMLDRPLDQLSLNDRPLTASKGVEAIAAERMELYRQWADIQVPCTGTAEGDAILVKGMLGL